MSIPKKAKTAAEAPAATPKAPRVYPAANDFTDMDLKELRAEFEALTASKADPTRLEELRALGKAAQAAIKARKAPAAAPAPEKKALLAAEALDALALQMNRVMTLVPPLVPGSAELLDRVNAELKDINLADFVVNADHPEKQIFDDASKKSIRALGFAIPGEDLPKAPKAPKAAKPVGKKEFPSARQLIYKAWMAGEKDVEKLAALVNESVKKETIKTYLSDWSKGKYLPSGVTAPVIKDGKAVTK